MYLIEAARKLLQRAWLALAVAALALSPAHAAEISFADFVAGFDHAVPAQVSVCRLPKGTDFSGPWQYFILRQSGDDAELWYFSEAGEGHPAGYRITAEKEPFWEFMGGVWSIEFYSTELKHLEASETVDIRSWDLEQVKSQGDANPCPR